MKLLTIILLAAFCSGCATRVYEAGLPVLACYSNTSRLKFHTPKGTTLVMYNVDNSTPTRVGLDGITKLGTAVGTAVLSHGASAVIPHK